jgi:hypothetical protein
VLEAIPSFSICESAIDESEETAEEEGDPDLSFLDEGRNVGATIPPLFLARGLGIDQVGSGMLSAGGDFGGGGGNGKGRGRGCSVTTDNGGNRSDLELYYKKMVEQHPTDPLFLRNYAQFLYQVRLLPELFVSLAFLLLFLLQFFYNNQLLKYSFQMITADFELHNVNNLIMNLNNSGMWSFASLIPVCT